MSQHFLNGFQVGTVLQEMCRKAVAQCVRRNLLIDLRFFLIMLNEFPKALAGHSLTRHVDKEGRLIIIRNQLRTYVRDVLIQRIYYNSC